MPTATRRRGQIASSPHPKSGDQQLTPSATVHDADVQMGSSPYTFAVSADAFSEQLRSHNGRDPLQQPTPPSLSNGTASSASSDTVTGFQSVGQYMQELMETVKKLEQLGIERSNIPVPRIVVTGDQSSGKSSFIEAISHISVPRNAGTCTRCPTQITTSISDAGWTCSVKLVQRYTYYGSEFLAERGDCYVPEAFHPWQESKTVIFDFAQLTDPSTVCETIERAQAAILHPSQNPAKFQSGSLPPSGEAEVRFSPNYISLEISGPNLPNLSFYDLPGVISRTRNPDESYLVGLVENLVREYISEESSIVLLAIALEQDQEHSRTSRLIEEAGAKDRCVGVLTKPDKLAEGAPVSGLDKILSGQDLPLGHGYFVTKQPDQTQRSLRHSDARGLEDLFFTRQAPWSTELSHHQAHFGTRNIQNALSKLLFEQITASLPHIREKLTSKLQLIDEELATLPEVPAQEVIHIVSSCITTFSEAVQTFVRGRYPHNELRNQWRKEKEKFKDRITELRPRLQLTMAQDSADVAKLLKRSPGKSRPPIDVMDLTEKGDVGTPVPVQVQTTPKKRKMEEGDPFLTPTPKRPSRPTSQDYETFTIDQIRTFLDSYSAVGLHGTYDPEAVEQLILHSLKWGQPAKLLSDGAERSLGEALKTATAKCLHGYEKTQLYTELQSGVKDFLADKLSRYDQHASLMLKHEKHQPSTMFENAHKVMTTSALAELKEARFRVRAKSYLDAQAEATNKALDLDKILKTPKDRQDLENVLRVDPAAREIDVMSNIRAYYSVASMRFADNICRAFEVEVLEELKNGLKQHLETHLLFCEQNVQDRCAELLAEDPASERRRTHLKQEKRHLQAASQMLDELVEKYGTDLRGVDFDG